MPSQLQRATFRAPGSRGLVTELVAEASDPRWALVLNNAVINDADRIAARKGWDMLTSSPHSDATDAMYEHIYNGTTYVVSAADTAIYTGTTTLTDRTNPVGGLTAPTAADWQFVSMNEKLYGFQASHTPIVWDPSGATYDANDFQDLAPAVGTAPNGNAAIVTHGRIFAFDADMQTIQFCPLLNDDDWSGAGSGSLNMQNVWPVGDVGVGLAEWNNLLVVFGERSVVIFDGLDDPNNNLALASATAGPAGLDDMLTIDGLAGRDAWAAVGTDLIYLSRSGLRALKRGLVSQTLPLSSLAPHLRTAISTDVDTAIDAGSSIKLRYHRDLGALLAKIGTNYWYFDVKRQDFVRASRWTGNSWGDAVSIGGALYFGQTGGVGLYDTWADDGTGYQFEFLSAWTQLGDRDFIAKRAHVTLSAGTDSSLNLSLGWNYRENIFSGSASLQVPDVSEYNIAEYGIGEYGDPSTLFTQAYNIGGSGSIAQFGLSALISGGKLDIQQIDLVGKVGRIHV